MKRMILKQQAVKENKAVSIYDDPELDQIGDYLSQLRTLRGLPFSYLVPDERLLPPESIRFFCLDENWLNALTDGALSVGRTAKVDLAVDQSYFGVIGKDADGKMSQYRFLTMHENHRSCSDARAACMEVKTGFILRSELVGKWKGLEVSGYSDKEERLEILRMESLSKEILICIFDGKLKKFVVSEPKTGLRFGAPGNEWKIKLRSIVDDPKHFGEVLPDSEIDLEQFTDPGGRLRVSDLAKKFEEKLIVPVKASQFAFEMIAVAKKAEFISGE